MNLEAKYHFRTPLGMEGLELEHGDIGSVPYGFIPFHARTDG